MYSSSLPTHRCIRVLHRSKQCYSSSIPRPVSSCAVFPFTSITDGKWLTSSTLFSLGYTKKAQGAKSANMEDVQVLECIYWEETSWWKGVVSLGIVLMQHPDVVLPDIRPFLPQDLSHCLSVNTRHVCNHSHTQMSIFANSFIDFSECFGWFLK